MSKFLYTKTLNHLTPKVITLKKKFFRVFRYVIFCGILVFVIVLFGRGENNNATNTVPASKIGSGIIITNTEVDSPYGYLCNYKIQQANTSVGNQDIKIQISVTRKDGYPVGHFSWEDKPLYTGSPRIDYLNNLPCTTNVDDNGVTQMFYTLYNSSGKEVDAGYMDVSTNYSEAPTPTLPFVLQDQCGQEARDFIKQFYNSQSLLESAYSNQLHACVAYTNDAFDISNVLAPTNKTIYNLSTNKLLGGYTFIAPTSKYPATSQYWVDNSDPSQQNVTFGEFNRYKQSLGLSPSDQFGD